MKLRSLVAIALLFLAGCSSQPVQQFVCNAEQTVSQKATDLIVSGGECEATDQVKADVFAFVKSFGPCKSSSARTGVASDVCDLLVEAGVNKLASKAYASKWKCKVTNLSTVVKAGLGAGCGFLPVAERACWAPPRT